MRSRSRLEGAGHVVPHQLRDRRHQRMAVRPGAVRERKRHVGGLGARLRRRPLMAPPRGGASRPRRAAFQAAAKGSLSHSFCCLSPAKSQYMLYYCRIAKSLNNLNELANEKSEHSERFVRRDVACSAHERLCEGHHLVTALTDDVDERAAYLKGLFDEVYLKDIREQHGNGECDATDKKRFSDGGGRRNGGRYAARCDRNGRVRSQPATSTYEMRGESRNEQVVRCGGKT